MSENKRQTNKQVVSFRKQLRKHSVKMVLFKINCLRTSTIDSCFFYTIYAAADVKLYMPLARKSAQNDCES